MRTFFALACAAAAASIAAPAGAGIPVTQTMTCPIGGESFEFTTTASLSTYGERPDGKPYGSWRFPLALPECPDSGLVLYKEYDEDEVAKLTPLIKSDAYKALRAQGDTQYYRAYWLMREMGLAPERYLWALLQAAWEADERPDLRARYLAELAEASAAVEAKPDDVNWIGMEGRAVNALRELGRFDEALARLEKVAPLVGAPDRAGAAEEESETAKARKSWARYFAGMRGLIEAQNAATEPFEMIPPSVAIGRCLDKADALEDHQRAFCERDSVAVDKMRVERDAFEGEMDALADKREKNGR